MMQKYCPVCKKTVGVKQVGHRHCKCKECGHNIKFKQKELKGYVTKTFGKNRV